MTDENKDADDGDASTGDYEPLESAVNNAQEKLKDVIDALPQVYEPDTEDVAARLEEIEDDVDDAQDAADSTLLGDTPATVDYVQALASVVATQAGEGGAEFEEFATTMEGVEDRLEHFDIERTRWFARVNDVPLLSPDREVTAGWLINEALDPDDVSNYTLEAYTSTVDDEPDRQYPRPEQEVDLADFDVYRTARDKGGGPV